jgi:hypothetical protein
MPERWRQSLSGLETVEPSPDVWVRALARSAEGPSADVPAEGRRRILAALVATAVAATGLLVAFLSLRELGRAPGAGGLVTYRDPVEAWEVDYPGRFRQGTIPWEFVRPSVKGIWIGNFDSPSFSDRTIALLTQLPDEGVVVLAYQTFGGLDTWPVQRDSSFPVSFDELGVVPGVYRGVWRTDRVLANGELYTITVRLGLEASQEDQEAAADIVSSFRILPLEEGTAIGQGLTFYVLGPPESYPVGSVMRFDASSLPRSEHANPFPFYLVHIPEGFYALAWPADRVGGYQDCEVTHDPAAQEFSCTNGARWALDGSVIAKPEPGLPEDPLRVLLVRISLDDHLLVSPNVFMSDTELDLRMTGG